MSVEIAWKQNILVTDFHLLKSLLAVLGFGSQAFVCGFSRQNINSVQFILNWFSVLCARKDSPTQSGKAVPKLYISSPIQSMLEYALTHEMSCMCIDLFDRKKDTLNKTNYHHFSL